MAKAKRSFYRSFKENLTGYMFVLPYFCFFGLFTLYPILQGFFMSLTERDIFGFDIRFVGLKNYAQMLTDQRFWTALKNTASFTLMDVPTNVVLAILLATLLNRHFRGKEISLSMVFFPRLLSISVIAFIWLWLYEPEWGLLNHYLSFLGVGPINWLRDPSVALRAVVVATVWWTVGNNVVLFMAGMQQIPTEVYEAAELDGSVGLHRFFRITLPLLRPTAQFVVIMQIIASFQIFGQVNIMTGGGPAGATRVLVQYIYETGFSYFEMGYAAALSYILFLLIMVVSVIQLVWLRER